MADRPVDRSGERRCRGRAGALRLEALAVAGLFVGVAAGCSDSPEPAPWTTSRDPDGVTVFELDLADLDALPGWTLSDVPTVVIGGKEGVEGHDLFGVQSGFVISTGDIVIANSGTNELRVFSSDGEFVRTAGGKGEGPGEFSALYRADVLPGDTIVTYDSWARRLSLFDENGAFLADTRVTPPHEGSFPLSMGVFDTGRAVVAPGLDRVFTRGERRDTALYLLYERDGTILDTLASLPGTEMVYVVTPDMAIRSEIAFGRSAFAAVGGGTLAIGANDTYEFEIMDPDGGVVARVRVDAPPCEVTDAEVRAWKDQRLSQGGTRFREMAEAVVAEMPPRETHPAFATLKVDRLGYVWVGRHQCDTDVLAWDVYAPDGRPVGRLLTDRDLTLLDIGEDYLLILVRDELDREIVRRVALERRE